MTPNIVRKVHKELETIVSYLIGTGIINDQNFPKIVSHPKSIWDVKFDYYENIALVMSETDYSLIHQILTNNRCYSVKMIDGGLLQLIYRFQGNTLIQHRLAYYPSPQLLPFQEDPASYFEDTHFLEIINRRIIAFPLRFDFDQQAAINKTHPACHLTLGDAKNCRIPVSKPITPRWFFEFILWNFYRTNECSFTEDMPNHEHSFEQTLTKDETGMVHVVIPDIE